MEVGLRDEDTYNNHYSLWVCMLCVFVQVFSLVTRWYQGGWKLTDSLPSAPSSKREILSTGIANRRIGLASSPASPIFFNARIEKDRGAWGRG